MKICLNMIVKNESKQIERLLESVCPHIAFYVIVDTGSTDDTIAKIQAYCAARNVQGKIVNAQFVNFSQARNVALAAASQHAGHCDYLLLADADMQLVVTNPDVLARLTADGYLVEQVAGRTRYWNMRLMKVGISGIYRAVTHEYLDVAGRTEMLTGVHFIDHADGSNRGDKFQRDEALLKDGLANECGLAMRYLFYLGQTYSGMGRTAEAARWLAIRADLGGWPDERWYARFSAGANYWNLRDDRCLWHLEQAVQDDPNRAEPLALLAEIALERGNHGLAVEYARRALALPIPLCGLFIDETAFRDRPLSTLVVAGWYAKSLAEGYDACNLLAVQEGVHPNHRMQTARNYRWYAKSLKEMCPSATVIRIPFQPEDKNYSAATMTTLIRADGQRVGFLRTANYAYMDATNMKIQVYGGLVVKTVYYYATFDENWKITSSRPVNLLCAPPPYQSPVEGFEDWRVMEVDGKLFATAMCTQYNEKRRPKQVLLDLADNGDILRVTPAIDAPDAVEKNWVPIEGQGRNLLYRLDPRRIIRIEPSGEITEVMPVSTQGRGLDLASAFNSSQVMKHPTKANAWVMLVHTWVYFENAPRTYYQRVVELDADFKVLRISPMFYFETLGIEYCAGLTFDKGMAIIPFSKQDRESFIMKVPVEEFLAVMVDVQRVQWDRSTGCDIGKVWRT